MITLRITTGKHSRTASFDQNEIFIGPKGSELCDIGIQGPGLSNPHCKIVNQEGRIVIINTADDPELLVDNLAFGRRTLVPGSKVSLYDTTIELAPAEETPQFVEVERLLEEVETLDTPEPAPQIEAQTKNWIPTLLISAGVLLVLGIALTSISYVRSQKTVQEMWAAASIADAAMTLLADESIRDPDALEGRARALLQGRRTFLDLDSAGNLQNSPYTLTPLPSQGGKSVTLIASPKGGLLRKISPLDTFLVDTATMKLHKISQVTERERLQDPKRLQLLMNETESLSLNTLNEQFPGQGFEPAQNARQLDPESPAYLYNAPRYSKFLSEKELIKLPHAILYSGLGRNEAKNFARTLSAESGAPILIAYSYGSPYQGADSYRAARISTPKAEVAPPPPVPPEGITARLTALKEARREKLASASEKIREALSAEIQTPKAGARNKLRLLVKQFEQLDVASQNEIKAALSELYNSEVKENKNLSTEQFRQNLISEGFEGFLDNPR